MEGKLTRDSNLLLDFSGYEARNKVQLSLSDDFVNEIKTIVSDVLDKRHKENAVYREYTNEDFFKYQYGIECEILDIKNKKRRKGKYSQFTYEELQMLFMAVVCKRNQLADN